MTKKNSDRYHDYLIGSLRDPEEAAAYLAVALAEEDSDPVLLKKAFVNVLEALGETDCSPEQLVDYQEQTEHLFASTNCSAIGEFVNWFNRVGLKLAVVVNESEPPTPAEPMLDLATQTDRL